MIDVESSSTSHVVVRGSVLMIFSVGHCQLPKASHCAPHLQGSCLHCQTSWTTAALYVHCEESWVPKNWCFWTVVLEKTLESPLDGKEIQTVHSKGDQPWVFFGRNDAKAETPVLWPPHAKSWLIGKDSWCWEGLGAEGEGDDRGWDGWMASLTRWAWIWVNSGSWWWTGRPGMLRFMVSQTVGHDWATELNWTELAVPVLNALL